MEKVAIYLRLSREHGEDADSLRNHRDTLITLAEEKGYDYTLYSDGISSSQDDHREQYLKMIADIKQGMYTAVLAHDVDRLGRKGSTLLSLADVLKQHNIKVITPRQEFDLTEDSSKMMFAFSSIFAEQEYSQIRRRMLQGKYKASQQGKSLHSITAFGYTKDEDKRLIPDEDEAKVYRTAIEMALQGYSFKYISRKLNEWGYRGKRGKKFSLVTVHRFVTNPVYRGILEYSNTEGDIRIEDNHEALLSQQEYLMLTEMAVKRRKHYSKTKNTKALFITAGMYTCKLCSRRHNVNRSKKVNKGGDIYYTQIIKGCSNEKCTNYGTNLDDIEDAVIESVQAHAEEIKKELDALQSDDLDSVFKQIRDKIADIDKELKQVEDKEKNLINLAVAGALSTQELIDQREVVNKDKSYLQDQRGSYEQSLEQMDSSTLEKKLEYLLCNVSKLQTTRQIRQRYSEEEADEIIVAVNNFLKSIISKIAYYKPEQGRKKQAQIYIEWDE